MSRSSRHIVVYLLLLAAWLGMAGWLAFEQRGVVEQSRGALLNRARDITNTIALLVRSGGPGVVRQSRIERALGELTKSGELLSVELVNSSGEVLTQVGQPLNLSPADMQQQGPDWSDPGQVTLVNPVDFGTRSDERTSRPLTVVIPNLDEDTTNARRALRFAPPEGPLPSPYSVNDRTSEAARRDPFPYRRGEPPPWMNATVTSGTTESRAQEWRRRQRDRDRERIFFRKPPWLNEREWQSLLEQQGLHAFVLVLSTAEMDATIQRDLLLRITLGAIALLALGAIGFFWRGLASSTRLQMRLVRAHEVNSHLREMNLAAAGLAHETRNPLNIVRGMATLITQNMAVPAETRDRAQRITEEVDRVTGRLNEFINYSRPLEPRAAPTDLPAVIRDVTRTLETDLADKRIRFELEIAPVTVQADEALLRQVIFNLILNAVQAVPAGGTISATLARNLRGEGVLSINDTGAGVPDELREEIFKPYFTNSAKGTGLGLAVVKQIALAHHWEIDYVRNDKGGATFRVHGLILA